MAYRFRLATVLRFRQREEKLRALAAAAAARQRDGLAVELGVARAEVAARGEALVTAGRQGTTGDALAALSAGIQRATRRVSSVGEELARAHARFEALHAQLVAAARDRQLLERLEASGREAHRTADLARAQRHLDDVVRAPQGDAHEGNGR